MTTPHTRSLVSFATALALTLGAAGCASVPPRTASAAPVPADAPATIRFDNDSREYVDVYLIGERREWRLARVAAGARTTLRVPEDALAEDAGRMRLAVLPGQRGATLRATSDMRAASALARPVGEILSQQWTFSQTLERGHPAGLLLGRLPVGRP